MMRAPERGFSLLEAIVALTILCAALLGAYAWIATDVRALRHVRELALEEAAVRQAITELEQTDLAAQPAGSIDWRDFRIEWSAAAVEPARPGRTSVGGPGLYELTLQQVRLAVFQDGRLIGTPELRITQFARTREKAGSGRP
jgi:general secretion pathway protein I